MTVLIPYSKAGRFRDAAMAAHRYVGSAVRLDGPEETRGAVKGSFSVSGDYTKFQYPNWACRYFRLHWSSVGVISAAYFFDSFLSSSPNSGGFLARPPAALPRLESVAPGD